MKWKCNTFECGHIFEDNTTEQEINKEDFKSPICPKCKNKNNRSFRVEVF